MCFLLLGDHFGWKIRPQELSITDIPHSISFVNWFNNQTTIYTAFPVKIPEPGIIKKSEPLYRTGSSCVQCLGEPSSTTFLHFKSQIGSPKCYAIRPSFCLKRLVMDKPRFASRFSLSVVHGSSFVSTIADRYLFVVF